MQPWSKEVKLTKSTPRHKLFENTFPLGGENTEAGGEIKNEESTGHLKDREQTREAENRDVKKKTAINCKKTGQALMRGAASGLSPDHRGQGKSKEVEIGGEVSRAPGTKIPQKLGNSGAEAKRYHGRLQKDLGVILSPYHDEPLYKSKELI